MEWRLEVTSYTTMLRLRIIDAGNKSSMQISRVADGFKARFVSNISRKIIRNQTAAMSELASDIQELIRFYNLVYTGTLLDMANPSNVTTEVKENKEGGFFNVATLILPDYAEELETQEGWKPYADGVDPELEEWVNSTQGYLSDRRPRSKVDVFREGQVRVRPYPIITPAIDKFRRRLAEGEDLEIEEIVDDYVKSSGWFHRK